MLALGYLFVGNIFQSEPLPMTVQEVSVISSAQFAAMQAAQVAPSVETEVALPQVEAPDEVALETPEQVDTPEVEPTPELQQPEPEPEAEPEVIDRSPLPDAAPEPEVPQPPAEDVAVLAPPDETPVPQQADRIAPDPVEQPDPEAAPDDVPQEEVVEDSSGQVEQETQEATAPEETTTEIVTEADEPASSATAPTRSIRPPSNRPSRPVRTAQPAAEPEANPEPAPSEDATADAIAQAVAQAQETPSAAAPSGPPLTGSELEGLRVSVGRCWNVGTLSTEATETVVTAFVRMNRDGTPDNGSIRMLSYDGGSEAAAKRVFDTARRAIIRCGARGFPLPVEKYGQWREIEMTFNPEGVFWR